MQIRRRVSRCYVQHQVLSACGRSVRVTFSVSAIAIYYFTNILRRYCGFIVKRDCVIGLHNYAVPVIGNRSSSVIYELNTAKKDEQFIQLRVQSDVYSKHADGELLEEAVRSAGELCGENTFSKDNSQAAQDFVKTLDCRKPRRVKTILTRGSLSRAHVDG